MSSDWLFLLDSEWSIPPGSNTWASYYNYKNLQITGLLAFFVFCVLKCAMLAKFKKDILEKDTPLLFKVSNHVFGIAFIIMDIFIFYVNR